MPGARGRAKLPGAALQPTDTPLDDRPSPATPARALAAATLVVTTLAGALVFSEALRPLAIASGVLAPPPLRAEHADLRAIDPNRAPRVALDEARPRLPLPVVPREDEAAPAHPPGVERVAPAPHGSQTRAHAAAPLSLRATPEPGSPELGKLPVGEPVLVLDRKGTSSLVLATGPDGVLMGWVDTKGLGP